MEISTTTTKRKRGRMKITDVDILINEFRKGRNTWPRASIELFVREITRLNNHIAMIKSLYPLAYKLIAKKKSFIVVAIDEPYYKDVYEMIRDEEIKQDDWSDQDEEIFIRSCRINKDMLKVK